MIRFEWDPAKARTNQRKHRTDEAGEPRWQVLGLVGEAAVLLVAHTVRPERDDEVIRLISARRATRKERYRYEQTRAQDAY